MTDPEIIANNIIGTTLKRHYPNLKQSDFPGSAGLCVRDLTIYGLRQAGISAVDICNVRYPDHWVVSGDKSIIQTRNTEVILSESVTRLIQGWISLRGKEHGFLFCKFDKFGSPDVIGKLKSDGISSVMTRARTALHLRPDPVLSEAASRGHETRRRKRASKKAQPRAGTKTSRMSATGPNPSYPPSKEPISQVVAPAAQPAAISTSPWIYFVAGLAIGLLIATLYFAT